MAGMEPSSLELEAMKSLKDLFEWVPIRPPQSDALLSYLDFQPEDPIRLLSKATAEDIDGMLLAIAGAPHPLLIPGVVAVSFLVGFCSHLYADRLLCERRVYIGRSLDEALGDGIL